MSSIFESVTFYNSKANNCETKNEKEYANFVLESGSLIKNCDFIVSESLINECYGDERLVEMAVLAEGAKIDWALNNFMKEGEDYKGLKKDLNEIIKANNMSEDELKSKGKGFVHVCKRILQVLVDLSVTVQSAKLGLSIGSAISKVLSPQALIIHIAFFVVNFISSRLFRLLYDTMEFNTVKKDAESILADLRKMADEATDKKTKERYNSEADKLEASIEKYSNKRKENKKKEEESSDK